MPPDEDSEEERMANRLTRQFWRIVSVYMAGLALGVAISAIIVIFLIALYIFLEIH